MTERGRLQSGRVADGSIEENGHGGRLGDRWGESWRKVWDASCWELICDTSLRAQWVYKQEEQMDELIGMSTVMDLE